MGASSFDVVVIDHACSPGRRIVDAHMSIGRAERERFYWDQAWYDPP
jgi:endo-alpha-1,4-polygalactosaminidase (GH114 family)